MALTVQPHGLAMAQLVSSIVFGILSTIVIFLRAQIRFRDKVFGVDDALMTAGYVSGLFGHSFVSDAADTLGARYSSHVSSAYRVKLHITEWVPTIMNYQKG
jgi:hypothetical protein